MKNYITEIFDRDTILHLRIPFSLFLFPIFCFGLSQAANINWFNILIVFLVLHFFIYPGSNAYNSYMDKDKGSIGGLKAPPPVTIKVYYASIIFDVIGIALCLLVSYKLVLLILIYVLTSKAYSWHAIRLKKHGILSWFIVALFQGGYTYLIVNMCSENNFTPTWFTPKNFEAMLIATLLIGGFYPLTQIYQHEEDSSRGDFTISYKLGIIGTFLFTALLFVVANGISFNYFITYYTLKQFFLFNACLLPVTIYFLYWFFITLKNKIFADFDHSARMTLISSFCMIICFSVIFFSNHRF